MPINMDHSSNVQASETTKAPGLSFTISYRGAQLPITLSSTVSVLDLKSHLASNPSIGIPPEYQKLLLKGKSPDEGTSIEAAGVKDGAKIMLVGSTPTAIEGIHTALERKRAADSRAVSAARNRPSTREIHSIGSKDASSFTFHGLKALSQFPDRDRATALLARLRDDHAIKHILTQNRWAVGSLIEIHPLEQSSILGYNQNKGQVIALRLRTDALDGFRNYDSIRKVLLHELAHMVHSEHDDKFHKLNRELNTECDSVTKGARKVGSTSTYNSGLEDHVDVPPAFEGGTFKLGGGSNGSDAQGEVARREVLARAAMGRLTKEEIALVHSCGNASSASHSHEQSNGPS